MSMALGNRLLDALTDADLARLRPRLNRMPLRAGMTLDTCRHPTAAVYFPCGGVVSLLAHTQDGASVEVALTGADGMVGAFEAIGQSHTPLTARVQVEGEAWCLPVPAFQRLVLESSGLRSLLFGYLQCLLVQVTQSAVCNRFHASEQRLARWLLTTALVSGCDTFTLTHDGLAQMVGSPRSAITNAAAALRDAGLIDYARGRLTVCDRQGLEQAACECYRVVEQAVSGACALSPGRVA